jgi:hypothetical protein
MLIRRSLLHSAAALLASPAGHSSGESLRGEELTQQVEAYETSASPLGRLR